jgi:hypothetical protein
MLPDESMAILACKTIAHELESAIRTTKVSYPIVWVDSELHNRPETLREEIQSKIDSITETDTIILAFGLCGNGLVGLHSEAARLILPRTEDCIALLLGSQERRTMLAQDAPRYFLTKGWLESETSIAREYDYCVRKFGHKSGLRVMRMMLEGYRYFTFIETGGYDSGPYIAQTETLAQELGLDHQVIEGSSRFFEKLLLGPWDHEFIIIQPGNVTEFRHFFS